MTSCGQKPNLIYITTKCIENLYKYCEIFKTYIMYNYILTFLVNFYIIKLISINFFYVEGVKKVMKKRLLSLVLALALILGVIAPVASANAAGKTKYTRLTLASGVETEVNFFVLEDKRELAAQNLTKTLNSVMKKGSSFTIYVNGKEYTAKKTGKQGKGKIMVGDQTLADFIKANEGNSTWVTIKVDLKKALSYVKMAKKAATYGFRQEINDAKFKKIKITKKNKITFKGYVSGTEKTFTAYVKGGKIYLKGDQRKSEFVKELKKDGVIKSAKVVKVKTSSLSK